MQSINDFLWNLWREFNNYVNYCLTPLRYRVKATGLDELKDQLDPNSGILFLANHTSNVDPILIRTKLGWAGYKISIWAIEYIFTIPFLCYISKNVEGVRVVKVPCVEGYQNPKKATKYHKLLNRTADKLNKKQNILIFPSGQSKVIPREEIRGKGSVYHLLRLCPNVNVVLVRHRGLWGSRFSWASKRYKGWLDERIRFTYLIWDIAKMIVLNGIFFIPKRDVSINFKMAPSDFPRFGTRNEINAWLENYYNDGFKDNEEPLYCVPSYFWKPYYTTNEYYQTEQLFDESKIPIDIKNDVMDSVAKIANVPPSSLKLETKLADDLGMDSLQITTLIIELNKKYNIKDKKRFYSDMETVGLVMAVFAEIPITEKVIPGAFKQVIVQHPPLMLFHENSYVGFSETPDSLPKTHDHHPHHAHHERY